MVVAYISINIPYLSSLKVSVLEQWKWVGDLAWYGTFPHQIFHVQTLEGAFTLAHLDGTEAGGR